MSPKPPAVSHGMLLPVCSQIWVSHWQPLAAEMTLINGISHSGTQEAPACRQRQMLSNPTAGWTGEQQVQSPAMLSAMDMKVIPCRPDRLISVVCPQTSKGAQGKGLHDAGPALRSAVNTCTS